MFDAICSVEHSQLTYPLHPLTSFTRSTTRLLNTIATCLLVYHCNSLTRSQLQFTYSLTTAIRSLPYPFHHLLTRLPLQLANSLTRCHCNLLTRLPLQLTYLIPLQLAYSLTRAPPRLLAHHCNSLTQYRCNLLTCLPLLLA
jgi:hypothetical protein